MIGCHHTCQSFLTTSKILFFKRCYEQREQQCWKQPLYTKLNQLSSQAKFKDMRGWLMSHQMQRSRAKLNILLKYIETILKPLRGRPNDWGPEPSWPVCYSQRWQLPRRPPIRCHRACFFVRSWGPGWSGTCVGWGEVMSWFEGSVVIMVLFLFLLGID